jgi:hypothetical protein
MPDAGVGGNTVCPCRRSLDCRAGTDQERLCLAGGSEEASSVYRRRCCAQAKLDHPDDPTGPVWTCLDRPRRQSEKARSSGAVQIDAEHLATDPGDVLAIVGGSCQSRSVHQPSPDRTQAV